MDIIVEGKASRFFKPDKVILNINFYLAKVSYEEALKEGVEAVEVFIKNVLEKLNFTTDDMKTRSFTVREESHYNNDTKRYERDGFSYSQSATLSFDYDMERLSKFMEITSKLKYPPKYQIQFGIKNEANARSLVLADAYSKAEEKAKMIAHAASKKLKDCVKVDFKPFTEKVISQTTYDEPVLGKMMNMDMAARSSVSQIVQNIFTPEDVEICEKLYCLWITE